MTLLQIATNYFPRNKEDLLSQRELY